jgi:hypothetical protein
MPGDNCGSVSVYSFDHCEQCGQIVESKDNCPYCPHDFRKESLLGGQAAPCGDVSHEARRKEEEKFNEERRLFYDSDDRDQT